MKKITLQDIEEFIQCENICLEDDGGITFYFEDEEGNEASTYRGYTELKEWGCIDKDEEYNTDFDTLENPHFKEICEDILEKYEYRYY